MDSIRGEEGLRVVIGDVTIGLHGERFSYIFSCQAGGMESLVLDGREWLYRMPRPAFWRALTDNDRGNGFQFRSGMWLAADMYARCKEIRAVIDGEKIAFPLAPANNRYTGREYAKKASLAFVYETLTVPQTQVEVGYAVEATGRICVTVHYFGKKGLPGLPVFGMRFIMPTKASAYEYEGLSGETYPDRMAGGIPGIYKIEGLPVTKYLRPQDCNVHMDTKWVRVYRNTTLSNVTRQDNDADFGIEFAALGRNFAFSCIPYTALELENATHQEELPFARRTVLSVFGAVRGVGGIDSWGADVEEAYHIDAESDIVYSFCIQGI